MTAPLDLFAANTPGSNPGQAEPTTQPETPAAGLDWQLSPPKVDAAGKPRPRFYMPTNYPKPKQKRSIDAELRDHLSQQEARRRDRATPKPRTARQIAHDAAAEQGETEAREENDEE